MFYAEQYIFTPLRLAPVPAHSSFIHICVCGTKTYIDTEHYILYGTIDRHTAEFSTLACLHPF